MYSVYSDRIFQYFTPFLLKSSPVAPENTGVDSMYTVKIYVHKSTL